jgi:phosphoribosylaminoimidazolecarboxamide formyltransferase/IMP cyclohydrolase
LGESPPKVCRVYTKAADLKYGCNPHQKPAAIYSVADKTLPFEILNGNPGYINLLDATNAYQLVRELRIATGLAAASSFKHVSPAGAGVAVPLSETLAKAYEMTGKVLTPAALAYVRARNADPMSSFGDFAALSDVVDVATAMVLKSEVSDGIIAPGYEPEALAILSAKKGGKFIVLKAGADFVPPTEEFREVYGMGFMQKRNDVLIDSSKVEKVVTEGTIDDAAKRDMILASVCLKYTQSNSVGYAKDGQMVGVGAGQQSRVDCVKLAARKVTIWALRQHPKVLGLAFKAGVKRVERVNARVKYIEGDMTSIEKAAWVELFDTEPEPLTDAEKKAYMDGLDGISLSSDAFFPFRDSIDHAAKYGVSYVIQPGGSVQDEGVIKACQDYNMQMAFSDTRLFHH